MMADVTDLQAWKGKLQKQRQGGFKKSMTNLMLHLQNIRELGSNVRWNELAQRGEWGGKPLTDRHLVDIRMLLERENFECSPADVLPATIRHAYDNAYHPVRDYLRAQVWDGKPRLEKWLQSCLGTPDSLFTRIVGRRTLVAAVARAFQPGCKVDTVLIIEGEQGVFKSTAIKVLFGADWTAESVNLFDQHNKMVMSMMGAWVVELSEFIAIQKRDENMVKGMLSMSSDRVVLPYAKMASDHPRQCIFFGTINPGESGYLTDTTGNRRYWPVVATFADLDLIAKNRDQIWAEAYHAYTNGEIWWINTVDEATLAEYAVKGREVYDSWQEILERKLDDIQHLTTSEALNLIGVPNDRIDRRAELRVATCLKALGWRLSIAKDSDRKSFRRWVRNG